MHKLLREGYRQVLEIKENKIRTRNTELVIEDYEIFIKSSDLNEVQHILQILSAITKTLRLKWKQLRGVFLNTFILPCILTL